MRGGRDEEEEEVPLRGKKKQQARTGFEGK